jgi:CRISPR-associated protein Csm4
MTLSFQTYFLFPRPPASLYHFGEWTLEDSSHIIHSDTLFSALVNVCALLFGDSGPRELIDSAQHGSFRLSSAFPCVRVIRNSGSTTHCFFPRPRIPIAKSQLAQEPLGKKQLKTMRFLSHTLFQKLLSQSVMEDGEPRAVINLREEAQLLFKHFYISSEDARLASINTLQGTSPFSLLVSPKVTLDRLTSASELWDQTDLLLRELALRNGTRVCPGFFFLVQEMPEVLRKTVEATLSLLVEEGIGGKRSSGRGLFASFEKSQISFNLPSDARFSVNLSLLFPTKEETNGFIAYDFLKRGGFVHSGRGTSVQKAVIRMLAEGSVHLGRPSGTLKEVALAQEDPFNHPIYKYGLAFPIPFGETP